MKNSARTLGAVAVLSAIVACDGSGSSSPDRQAFGVAAGAASTTAVINARSVVADDASSSTGANAVGGVQSLLLEGQPMAASDAGAADLTISGAEVTDGERSLHYTFTVTNQDGSDVPVESLSIALEIAAGGSFADSYRIPLYDVREINEGQPAASMQFTARSSKADLPAAAYDARLVVNPNWQHLFDIVPEGHNATQPFRYLGESDYQNNASGVLRVNGSAATVCTEDAHENDDSVATATVLGVGAQLEASLCLDDVDFFSVLLSAGEIASMTFAYTDEVSNPNPATRYVVLDSNFNRITDPTVAREANSIVINATQAGQYYVGFFGKRSAYRLTRASGTGLAADQASESLFHPQTISGPQSWLYGDIVLQRLALSEANLRDQVVNCGRITTQYSNGQPVAYVTPDHFAENHEFRFLSNGSYLVDGERHNGWHIEDGDISHAHWYDYSYRGYAENIGTNRWRYWSSDGLGYVDCLLEVNR